MYSVNVTELLPYTMYLCIVYGNNSGGAGPNTTATVWTLQDSKWNLPMLSIGTPCGVLIKEVLIKDVLIKDVLIKEVLIKEV